MRRDFLYRLRNYPLLHRNSYAHRVIPKHIIDIYAGPVAQQHASNDISAVVVALASAPLSSNLVEKIWNKKEDLQIKLD